MIITPWFFAVIFSLLGLWTFVELHYLRVGLGNMLPQSARHTARIQNLSLVLLVVMMSCTGVCIAWSFLRAEPYWGHLFNWAIIPLGILHGMLTVFLPFVWLDDYMRRRRIRRWRTGLGNRPDVDTAPEHISRRNFLVKAGAVAGLAPLAIGGQSVLVGRHDFQLRELEIASERVPAPFDGFRIVQFSDLHIGSFASREALERGLQLVQDARADVIVFTGDWVNSTARELEGYDDLLQALDAPYGKWACLGNHDYGIYVPTATENEVLQHFDDIKSRVNRMGFKLLVNDNTVLEQDGERIALLGVDFYGKHGPFRPDLALANDKLSADDFKVLLSHSPTYWDDVVKQSAYTIDLTLSGHTHGMQFGIDTKMFRWSPVSAMFRRWADLYTENGQHLYVNRGLGYNFFPGRFGVLPEVTVFTLRRR